MVIYTPRLCNDVAFQPPQENRPNAITCQPVVASEDVEAWTSISSQIRNAEELMAMAAEHEAKHSDVPQPIIGGIEVGGKKLVGTEGKVIEKSVVAGGGKEIHLGVVATSNGRNMNEKELKELNINDPKAIERLKRDVQKLAGKKGWRLELVETPLGREYRGIIETDENDDDSSSSKSSNSGQQQGEGKEGEGTKEEETPGSEEVYKDEL
jgi:protein OS-9